MIIPVSILFSLAAFLYLGKNSKELDFANRSNSIVIMWLVLILVAVFRPTEMNDYRDYLIGYNSIVEGDFGRWEPGYWYLMYILRYINAEFICLLLVMAATSIGIRLYAINKITPLFWGSITVYLSNLFILHDMIQMRCAIASGLLILAIFYKVNKKWMKFFISCVIAISFHYSSIIILLILILSDKFKRIQFYILLLPATYILVGFFHFYSTILFSKFPLIGAYIEAYAVNHQQGEVNIFNALQLIRCSICILLWIFSDRIPYNKYFFTFLKVYTLSLCFLPLFSDIYVISYRLSEFYLVSEIIVIPFFAYVFKPHIQLGKLSVVAISSVFLLMNIFYNKYLL